MQTIEYTRTLPIRYRADIAVIGGGIAGVCAAAAAAQSGASVILVERFASLGGMMTVGGVNNFCGESAGQGEVFDEILMVVLQEMLLKRGVKLLLHTRFVEVIKEGDRIDACVVRGPSGPETLRAKHFIDTTGEAEVAHLAGCRTLKGRPQDGLQFPMSMMWFLRHLPANQAKPKVPAGWFEEFKTQEDLPMVSPWPNGPGSDAIKIKAAGFDSTDTESLTAAEIHGWQCMMSVLDNYQRVENKPWHLDHCSPIIGIREGRRVVGDTILTEADYRAGRFFDDGVAMMGQAVGIAAALGAAGNQDARSVHAQAVRRTVVDRKGKLEA